jgi:hypothetical protein
VEPSPQAIDESRATGRRGRMKVLRHRGCQCRPWANPADPPTRLEWLLFAQGARDAFVTRSAR